MTSQTRVSRKFAFAVWFLGTGIETCHPGQSPGRSTRDVGDGRQIHLLLLCNVRIVSLTSGQRGDMTSMAGSPFGTRDRFRQGVDLGRRRAEPGHASARGSMVRSRIEFTDRGQASNRVSGYSEIPYQAWRMEVDVCCRRACESITELPTQARAGWSSDISKA